MDNENSGHCYSVTGVFWDVEEIPIPKDVNLPSISGNIESALEKLGFYALEPVEFIALGEKKDIASKGEWFEADIYYVSEGDKDTRVNLMSFHILNWASSSFKRQPNVMLISRNLPDDTEFVRVFNALKSRGFNVLLVQPHDEAASKELLRNADSISDSTRFFNGGNPLDDQSGSSQGSLVSNSLAIETINNEDFSKPIARVDGPKTGVFWDVDDSSLPNDLDPQSIYQRIRTDLEKKDYYIYEMSIWAYAEKITLSDELLHEYRKSKIYFLPKVPGDKNARHNMMLHDISLWAIDTPVAYPAPSNVIVISNNIQGDDVKTDGIPRVIDLIFTLEGLYSRGYNAFLVQPNLLAPEMSQTSEWPGCVLDVGKVTGRFLLAPSQMKRMRKKVKPRRIRQGRRALRED
ncbi:unnamed protein product [Arabidopsis lyrata]|uniref:uncharacterized protein LOC9317553 n=1 Tax=Arabidopsis lyrata subsp. lyrata TaxID=81972 RepID=UPI000A29AB94|nr:uncharacterized protein LOC9317553 [Arabidopsis lyrata subsp. lyrata]CAH8264955.1 unnamed protein product [Arabidopsis lyrata]|eukprot:XP_020885014.1 uncharacterized protein LOC9317553 [Arabidopsis lyrata subsp. lyrata]